MEQQMTLFDLGILQNVEGLNLPIPSGRLEKPMKVDPPKPKAPENLKFTSVLKLLKSYEFDGLLFLEKNSRYEPVCLDRYGFECDRQQVKYPLKMFYERNNATGIIKFIDNYGYGFYRTLEVQIEMIYDAISYRKKHIKLSDGFKISPWKQTDKLLSDGNYLKGSKSPDEFLNQYQKKFCELEGVSEEILFEAPYLETLSKAGYVFVHHFLKRHYPKDEIITLFNRLCQKGSKPSKIFKTISSVYETLKEEMDLSKWDVYRRMVKTGKIQNDAVVQCIQMNFQQRELDQIAAILNREYNGKKVFTFESLINYLVRIDQFEAISQKEGLQLLSDYLMMCQQLQMKPRVDGDSLKREHDIAARNVRLQRNEILAREMKTSCEWLQTFNHEDGQFLVRGVQSYDDLLDEANQQHNCVAGYADRIARRQSMIFFLRKNEAPKRSLVTIELSPKDFSVRQKFMAYNQPVRNKSITDFIDEWVKWIRTRERKVGAA